MDWPGVTGGDVETARRRALFSWWGMWGSALRWLVQCTRNANITTKSTGDEHTEVMNTYHHTGSLHIYACLHYLMHCSLVHIQYTWHTNAMCDKDFWPTSAMTSTCYCQLMSIMQFNTHLYMVSSGICVLSIGKKDLNPPLSFASSLHTLPFPKVQ